MKITVDTNILVRAAVQDDQWQAMQAMALLDAAEMVAIPLPVLCELVWVLSRGYKKSATEIESALWLLFEAHNVVMNRPAVEAGLLLLSAGGDFADGVIAHAGAELGADEFVSFDQKAVALLQARGKAARLPGEPGTMPLMVQQERAQYRVTRVARAKRP